MDERFGLTACYLVRGTQSLFRFLAFGDLAGKLFVSAAKARRSFVNLDLQLAPRLIEQILGAPPRCAHPGDEKCDNDKINYVVETRRIASWRWREDKIKNNRRKNQRKNARTSATEPEGYRNRGQKIESERMRPVERF